MMPACGAAGRTRSRRPVQAVRARRHPPSVRQPVPARSRRAVGAAGVGRRAVGGRPPVRHGPAMRGSAVRGSSLRGSAMRRSTPRGSPVLGSPVRHATARAVGIRAASVRPARMWPAHSWCAHRWHDRVRAARVRRSAVRERPKRSAAIQVPDTARPAAGHPGRHTGVASAPVRRRTRRDVARLRPPRLRASRLGPSRLRPSRLADPLLPGRHLTRAPQQLPEVVLVLGPTAWPGRIIVLGGIPVVGGIRPGAVAAAVPLVPGRTVRVTAEAGVATFHPIPPGPLRPAGAAGHLPSPP
jgi:hypothetical protein